MPVSTKKSKTKVKTKSGGKAVSKKAIKKVIKKVAKKAKAAGPLARVGQIVPDFAIQGTNGDLKLSALRGKKVVLYFYPRDATPGCTIEGHDFSRLLNDFHQSGAEVFGVSRDTLSSHEKFRSKENYTVHLLSDPEELTCNRFAVIKDKNMYGKKVRGIERSTFVIDQDGKLVKEWRKVNIEGHAEEVLSFIKDL